MFDGFKLDRISVGGASLRVRHGGSGPPMLLLHGHPRTHTTWHRVAPLLAPDFTVICPDLPGFGESGLSPDVPAELQSSKRAKAMLLVNLMAGLGFHRFALAGHDRGSYTAFRLAMDFPEAVDHLVIMDGVPILEALERCNARFAAAWWHWFFFYQPDKPERAINADPLAWYGGDPERMGHENYRDFLAAITNPCVVRSMLEDYRAGLAVDHLHDAADRAAGRIVKCKTMVLWSRKDDLESLYGDVLEVWQPWAKSIEGAPIDSGHHMAEEAPEAVAAALTNFVERQQSK
ncbi:alpha/beta fold hydrolase [Mesorhizobium sp. IMUNJ 23232]|uniref:alpha/beta fold hydrolase n=1 Tax=Mesorhizobium sp. IMUNJ 23232 TaxID=3376064 RepID=UPI0037A22101